MKILSITLFYISLVYFSVIHTAESNELLKQTLINQVILYSNRDKHSDKKHISQSTKKLCNAAKKNGISLDKILNPYRDDNNREYWLIIDVLQSGEKTLLSVLVNERNCIDICKEIPFNDKQMKPQEICLNLIQVKQKKVSEEMDNKETVVQNNSTYSSPAVELEDLTSKLLIIQKAEYFAKIAKQQ